jgi:hypothetical protein
VHGVEPDVQTEFVFTVLDLPAGKDHGSEHCQEQDHAGQFKAGREGRHE